MYNNAPYFNFKNKKKRKRGFLVWKAFTVNVVVRAKKKKKTNGESGNFTLLLIVRIEILMHILGIEESKEVGNWVPEEEGIVS